MRDYDIIIIGGGIAGASMASELAAEYRILILEQEFSPGYHSTGRSAAFWVQTYGGPFIEPLTTASQAFLRTPPEGFHEGTFLRQRGAINIAQTHDYDLAIKMLDEFQQSELGLKLVDKQYLHHKIPNLRDDWSIGITEENCCDIDVGALHNSYLKKARRLGADIHCSVTFEKAERNGASWTIQTDKDYYSAKILINAAGAWADDVAQKSNVKPIGIEAYRRTMVEVAIKEDISEDIPLIIGLDGSFYFKALPNNKIWLSPHDEIPSGACDTVPEDIDVAIALDRLQNIMDWNISKISHKWAGLRSFSPDRLPVIGFDENEAGFFWYAGQGGSGIQTSPAASQIAASIILEKPIPNSLKHIDLHHYNPSRFTKL